MVNRPFFLGSSSSSSHGIPAAPKKNDCHFSLTKIATAQFTVPISLPLAFQQVWSSSQRMLSLKDIVPAAGNTIHTQFILLEKGNPTREGQEKICLALVADETAAVHFQFWGDEIEAFNTGDIIHLSNGIFSYHKNNLVLRAGKRGKVEKVGEFTMKFVETPNLSEIRWGPDANNPKKLMQEAVTAPYSRLFPPLP